MPHVDGHYLDDGSSFGLLSLDADASIVLEFLPPTFQYVKGLAVGFFPIFNYSHTEILTYSIANWDDHELAEQMAIKYIGGGITSLEQIYNSDAQKGALTTLLAIGQMPDEYRSILQDILNYFNTPDFKRFYVNKNGVASSDYAIKQIINFYNQNPVAKKAMVAKAAIAKAKTTSMSASTKKSKKK